SDSAATHVSAQHGERPGFDPRMNDFAYTTTILLPDGGSYTLDVASTSSDILSISSTTGIPVSATLVRTGTAIDGATRFIGTPDRSTRERADDAATIDWRQATLKLDGS